MSIKIYTDAGSNLFQKILEKRGSSISVLPMSLFIDAKEYVCYRDDIDVETMSKEFYSKMREGLKPRTSLVAPGLFEAKAKEEISAGNQVIYVTLSSGISGTFQSASLIAREINEEAGQEAVSIIDSRTAGFGEGMIALEAERLATSGLPLEEVVKKTEEYRSSVRSEFTVDSIKYLANTGRVSNFTAMMADVLLIKPLLYGSDEGKIVVTSKVRGRKNALKKLEEQVLENIAYKDELVYIAHCDALEEASALKEKFLKAGLSNIEIYYYDLITGAHVGPGTIAVFYRGKNRTIEKKSIVSLLLGRSDKKAQ